MVKGHQKVVNAFIFNLKAEEIQHQGVSCHVIMYTFVFVVRIWQSGWSNAGQNTILHPWLCAHAQCH